SRCGCGEPLDHLGRSLVDTHSSMSFGAVRLCNSLLNSELGDLVKSFWGGKRLQIDLSFHHSLRHQQCGRGVGLYDIEQAIVDDPHLVLFPSTQLVSSAHRVQEREHDELVEDMGKQGGPQYEQDSSNQGDVGED